MICGSDPRPLCLVLPILLTSDIWHIYPVLAFFIAWYISCFITTILDLQFIEKVNDSLYLGSLILFSTCGGVSVGWTLDLSCHWVELEDENSVHKFKGAQPNLHS